MPDTQQLLEVLASLRERGAIGEQSLEGAVAHAASFVGALPLSCGRLIDLGSGGGLPGLVIAVQSSVPSITLVDRRERRMDLLRLACARLDLLDRVDVLTADVAQLGLRSDHRACYDAVTARAFASPQVTMSLAAPLLRVGGRLIVSEPPAVAGSAARWPDDELEQFGYVTVHHIDARVKVLQRL